MLDDVKPMVQLVKPQYPHTVGPVILPARICLATWHLIFFLLTFFLQGHVSEVSLPVLQQVK